MENMLNLIKALNESCDAIELRDGSMVFIEKKGEGEKEKIVGRYVIKLRPVANAKGVEAFKYVARKNK